MGGQDVLCGGLTLVLAPFAGLGGDDLDVLEFTEPLFCALKPFAARLTRLDAFQDGYFALVADALGHVLGAQLGTLDIVGGDQSNDLAALSTFVDAYDGNACLVCLLDSRND